MNFDTMSKQRKMVLIAAACGIICVFLPWWKISTVYFGETISSSGNGMQDGWGVVVFLCLLVSGALAYFGNQTANLNRTNWMIVIIAGAVATLIMLIKFFNSTNQLSLLQFGYYGCFSASIGVLLFAYNNRSADDSLSNGFDSLKGHLGNKMNATPKASEPNNTSNPTS